MAAGASTPRRGEPRRVQVKRQGDQFAFAFRLDIFTFFAGV
jgi:hypothetical protein